MWGQGKTAKQIAEVLGDGVTRNAVIGKAHRLGLSNRVSPVKEAVASKQKAQAEKKQAATKPAAKKTVPPANSNSRTNIQRPLSAEEERRRAGGGVSMLDLKESMCRWPIGDPRDADFCLCGARKMSGLPYCEDHAAVAYQITRKQNIQDFDDSRPVEFEEDKIVVSV